MNRGMHHQRLRGFTVIELLTVIAIIGMLAAILLPTASRGRVSANQAKTKVQFNQWAIAIESFRSEYGYYPAFHSSALVNGGASTTTSATHLFHDLLAGRKRDGSALTDAGTSGSAAAQNPKRIAFLAFVEGDFSPATDAAPHLLCDALGDQAIAVLVDKNLDGVISIGSGGDYASLPAVNGLTPLLGSAEDDFPSAGVRAGVVFYAPGPEATTSSPHFIFSWK